MNVMGMLGRALGRYLSQRLKHYRPLNTSLPGALAATLRPGDVLLVEGNTRPSTALRYLTQSAWSHAALYVGDVLGSTEPSGEPHTLIEADIVNGVCGIPLSKYATFHTRICRPVGLTEPDQQRVIS